jgi:hypothetical protein
VWWWPSLLSPSDIASIHNALQAMSATAGPDATLDRNSTAWAEDASGQYQAFGQDMAAQTEDGISIDGTVTNYATNSIDWSAATDVGTPTDCMAGAPANCDSTSGPLSSYNAGAEADTVGDDDGAGYEGARIATETTYTGSYIAWAMVTSGTETGATIDIQTDGTGSKTCTYSDLDGAASSVNGTVTALSLADWWRIECTTTIGGAPSATTADVLIGDAAADTGTLIFSARQAERSSFAGRLCLAGGSPATCLADNVSVATTGWPTSSGCVELTYTPEVADGFAADRFLLDAYDNAAGKGWYIYIVASTGVLRWYSRGVGAGTTKDSGALTWTAGASYDLEVRWYANGVVKGYRNDVLVINHTGADLATAAEATAYIGSTSGTSSSAMGRIKGGRVSK